MRMRLLLTTVTTVSIVASTVVSAPVVAAAAEERTPASDVHIGQSSAQTSATGKLKRRGKVKRIATIGAVKGPEVRELLGRAKSVEALPRKQLRKKLSKKQIRRYRMIVVDAKVVTPQALRRSKAVRSFFDAKKFVVVLHPKRAHKSALKSYTGT